MIHQKRCHFCGAGREETSILIAGDYAFICGSCVVKCVEILNAQIATKNTRIMAEPAKQGEGNEEADSRV